MHVRVRIVLVTVGVLIPRLLSEIEGRSGALPPSPTVNLEPATHPATTTPTPALGDVARATTSSRRSARGVVFSEPLEFGSLTIKGGPYDVWIDGAKLPKRSPLRRHRLKVGPHHVAVVVGPLTVEKLLFIEERADLEVAVDRETGTFRAATSNPFAIQEIGASRLGSEG